MLLKCSFNDIDNDVGDIRNNNRNKENKKLITTLKMVTKSL